MNDTTYDLEGAIEGTERICRDLMGWVEWKEGMPRVPETGYYHLHRGDGVQVTDALRFIFPFSPLTNANDDFEVLEAARRLWLTPALAWMETLPSNVKPPLEMRRWDAFQRGLPPAWKYEVGDFTRCVLSVLNLNP